MSWRKSRVRLLSASLLAGGFLLQFGNCAGVFLNFALGALDFCALTGTSDCTIGPFAPCGRPNVQVVDENGIPVGGVLNTEDDLLLDCPVTFIPQQGGG